MRKTVPRVDGWLADRKSPSSVTQMLSSGPRTTLIG